MDKGQTVNYAGCEWIFRGTASNGTLAILRPYGTKKTSFDIGVPIERVVPQQICQWFALCGHEATSTLKHPILGEVPICARCRAKVEALAQ